MLLVASGSMTPNHSAEVATAKVGSVDSIFGEVIHAYSRREAIADGLLVDVSETAREAGIGFPVAMTREAWEDCVAWAMEDNYRKGTIQDERGRLWDVVWMLRCFIRASRPSEGNGDRLLFSLYRTPRKGSGHVARKVTLKALCGPGDDAEPVITVMMTHED